MQRQMESFIGKVLHQSERWFHSNISREEAERRLQRCGCVNGLYLVRERKSPPGTYAMGLCCNGAVVHYLFDADSHGQLSIQSGPKFDNLMLALDHYCQTNDGLLYTLTEPCDVSLFEERRKTLPRPDFGFPGRPASRSFSEEASGPVVGSPPKCKKLKRKFLEREYVVRGGLRIFFRMGCIFKKGEQSHPREGCNLLE